MNNLLPNVFFVEGKSVTKSIGIYVLHFKQLPEQESVGIANYAKRKPSSVTIDEGFFVTASGFKPETF